MIQRSALVGGLIAATALTPVHAGPAAQPSSAQLTFGGAAPHEFVIASNGNPANPSLGARGFRFGIMSRIGAGYEIGDADDFDRDIERIGDDFDGLEDQVRRVDTMSNSEVEQLVDDIVAFEGDANTLVNDLTDQAYAKVHADISGPFAPLSVRSETLGGVLTVDYGAYVEARAAVESSGDAFSTGLENVSNVTSADYLGENEDGYPEVEINGTTYTFEPSEDAGLAVQGGVVGNLSGGYARELWRGDSGRLHAGATVNIYRVTLARSGVLLDDGDDASDTAEDEFEDNQERSNGIGIDVGAVWIADHYTLGVAARNLNEPSFDYPDPCANGDTRSCRFFQANPQAKRNGSSWTMERQATVEAALHTADRRWIATARVDTNSIVDTTGDDYQWAAVGASYMPEGFWIPSPRVGYRKNLAGEELSYVSAGATLFRFLQLDVSRSLETTSVDGNDGPRAWQASVGVDLQF